MIRRAFGWSDVVIDALTWEQFMGVCSDAVEVLREREREQYRVAAFVGWQILAALGTKPGSFQQYLKRLGLDG